MREVAVERELSRQVNRAGGMTVKLFAVTAGVPDRLVLLPPDQLFLVELKAPGGRLQPIQRAWHAQAGRVGVPVYVLSSTDEVKDFIAEKTESI